MAFEDRKVFGGPNEGEWPFDPWTPPEPPDDE